MIPIEEQIEKLRKKNDPKRMHLWSGPEHVCGLSGFGMSPDDSCDACHHTTCFVCGKSYGDGKHIGKYDRSDVFLRNEISDLRELIPLIREECAKIAEGDKLEQSGVIVAASERCDGGASERCADRIAAAIREGK